MRTMPTLTFAAALTAFAAADGREGGAGLPIACNHAATAWPDVLADCGSCAVHIKLSEKHSTCHSYCHSQQRGCDRAWAPDPTPGASCVGLLDESRSHPCNATTGGQSSICQCTHDSSLLHLLTRRRRLQARAPKEALPPQRQRREGDDTEAQPSVTQIMSTDGSMDESPSQAAAPLFLLCVCIFLAWAAYFWWKRRSQKDRLERQECFSPARCPHSSLCVTWLRACSPFLPAASCSYALAWSARFLVLGAQDPIFCSPTRPVHPPIHPPARLPARSLTHPPASTPQLFSSK